MELLYFIVKEAKAGLLSRCNLLCHDINRPTDGSRVFTTVFIPHDTRIYMFFNKTKKSLFFLFVPQNK